MEERATTSREDQRQEAQPEHLRARVMARAAAEQEQLLVVEEVVLQLQACSLSPHFL
jgi:hypothetical protein